jgi:hypothetical protein
MIEVKDIQEAEKTGRIMTVCPLCGKNVLMIRDKSTGVWKVLMRNGHEHVCNYEDRNDKNNIYPSC